MLNLPPQIWNVNDGTLLAEYKHQHGHLLSCQWSMLDADLVYTASADYSLHAWRPSQHKVTAAVTSNGQGQSSSPVSTGKRCSALYFGYGNWIKNHQAAPV